MDEQDELLHVQLKFIRVAEHMAESAQVVQESTQLGRQYCRTNLRNFQEHLSEQFPVPLHRIRDVILKGARYLLEDVLESCIDVMQHVTRRGNIAEPRRGNAAQRH